MTLLEPGIFYHIYNRGINGCNIFRTRNNYRHFLRLHQKYIDPIAETFAWALLKNHFHLLVRIKNEPEINLASLPVPTNINSFQSEERTLKKFHLYFSDFFNSYAKAYNKQEGRTGSLFERPFRRIHVDDSNYFTNLVVYIHNNPAHHGFTDDFREYPWSSYGTILSIEPSRIQRDKVIGWFNGKGEFVSTHKKLSYTEPFDKYIIE